MVSVILLAGGSGSRMKSQLPKQFLMLKGKPIVHYCLEIFTQINEVKEIVVVCNPAYEHFFKEINSSRPILFAQPGERRQDSVYNGLQKISSQAELVCIHDGVRPFISRQSISSVIKAASETGAAVVGVRLKFTIKEVGKNQMITNTPDRSLFWEIQTPQVMRPALLREGFHLAQKKQLTVTDDVSLVELLKHPVKIVESSYDNLKITTPHDLIFAESLLEKSCTTLN
jgi:2-C-methyl-D-erythritol 4-phosphate cytidylyltransferase